MIIHKFGTSKQKFKASLSHDSQNTFLSETGTYIMIYNLRKMPNGELEFDFKKDATDISIVEDETTTDNMLYARQDRINTNPTTYYSLRVDRMLCLF